MAFNKEIHTVVSRQATRNQLRKSNLQRKIRHLFLLTVSGGAFIVSPQLAQAEFTPNPNAPNYIASGNETTPQSITEDNVQIVTADDFSVETGGGTALTIEGAGAISYNDANESRLVATVSGSGLTITSTGDASGTPGSVTVVTNGTIQGVGTGIEATNNGTGNTTITTTGTVTGTTLAGIGAYNGDSAHDLTINAAAVTAGGTGIEAFSSGTGDISITATGDVTGGASGITVSHNGTGNTSVIATGTVVGTATDGINAFNNEAANDVTVNAVAASGGYSGIIARNLGTGNTTVTATGLVTGSTLFGVSASNTEQGKDVTVNVADVIGNDMGVQLNNNGTGDSTITATGTVEGTNLYGIYAENRGAQNDLTINVVDVTSNKVGIRATGTGDTSITATGTVSGLNNGGIIVSHLSETSRHISVNAMNVNGGQVGISVSNSGSGDTTVNATGTVTSLSGLGISASNGEIANDITVNVVDVSAATIGIEARNYGTGNTSITATGQVTGTQQYGIFAEVGETANDLTVNVMNVSGGQHGIAATNSGSGSTRITATGALVGENGNGIEVLNGETTQDLTVNVAAVSGGVSGIVAQNEGSGNTQITATGTVTGDTAYGVVVFNTANAQDLTVNVVDVWSEAYGIFVGNSGSGDTTITATGVVTGDTADGISVVNGETAGNLRVNVADVSGANSGILTFNAGSGSTSLVINGVVEGGTSAIDAESSGSQAIEITNNGTVRNRSQNPASLAITSGSAPVTINNNQYLLGTVTLGDGGNIVNNAGTWNVAGGTSELGDGANLIDNKSSGSIIAANAQGPVTTTFNGVSSFTHSGEIVLQNQEAGGQTAYVGDVAIFTNGGNGNFQSNGGRVLLDTDFENGGSDRLVVDNVSVASGPTRVYINPVGAITPTTQEGINVVEVLGDSVDDAFVMGNSVGRGLYSYQIGRGLSQETAQNWYLRESGEQRGEVPMASALSVLAGRTSLATLSSMHERQREGDDGSDNYASLSGTRLVSRSTTVTLPEADRIATKGVWGRVFGQNNNFSSEGGTGAGYDTTLWGAQAGIDLIAKGSQDTGRTYGGVYLGHASSSGDGLRGNTKLGTLKVDATTLGAYYTHINSSGLYWDAVAQYSRISDAKLKHMGDTADTEGSSYLASLEAGKQFNRDSKYVAELQGQLLYQKTSIDEIRLADSTRFDVGSQSGFTGRVGVRLARNPYQGASFQPWVSANVWRTFNQDVRVSSLGESVTTPSGGTTGEVQLGFSLVPQRASGWSAYFSGGYQFDVSGSEYSGWKGSLGVRKGW